MTYGALYLPGTRLFTRDTYASVCYTDVVLISAFGVISAYTNADGTIRAEFNQAIGLYMMAWMMYDHPILLILSSSHPLTPRLLTLIPLVFSPSRHLVNGLIEGSPSYSSSAHSVLQAPYSPL